MADRTVVLLRGMLREQRHWGDFLTCLRQKLPRYSLITVDIPGNGLLCDQKSPNTIRKITESVRKQVKPYAENGPLALVAISMGGMIALDWMDRAPHEIASAVLINTSVRSYAPFYRRLRWRNYAFLPLLFWSNPSKREQIILSLTSNRHGDDIHLLKLWQEWQRQHPVTRQNVLRQLLAASTYKIMRKPEPPTLLIGSRSDRLVDYRCGKALAAAWHTAYLEHPSAGHDLPLDEPQWLADQIGSWLASHGGVQPACRARN
ncbi:MAG: alpha/beta fold hydrolase [Gammaproteobacteria bacterium]